MVNADRGATGMRVPTLVYTDITWDVSQGPQITTPSIFSSDPETHETAHRPPSGGGAM